MRNSACGLVTRTRNFFLKLKIQNRIKGGMRYDR